MTIVPSPWPVVHIARGIDLTQEDDHGIHPVTVATPVVRWAMSIVQRGRNGSSHQIMSAEFLDRVETTVALVVADTTLYEPQDQVLLFPTLDSTKHYVTGTGTAYFVDGEANDERIGPWPGLLRLFGGTVKLRRVT